VGDIPRNPNPVLKKIKIIHTTIREIEGKRYQATTWDCTPPGHDDAYTLSRTEWKELPSSNKQLGLF
jgi:hypothetical protein